MEKSEFKDIKQNKNDQINKTIKTVCTLIRCALNQTKPLDDQEEDLGRNLLRSYNYILIILNKIITYKNERTNLNKIKKKNI